MASARLKDSLTALSPTTLAYCSVSSTFVAEKQPWITKTKKKLQDKARLLTAKTYRAQRSSAGYFAGYMSKRQGVGRFELAQAKKNLAWLKDKLQEKSNAHQFRAVLKAG